MWRPNILLKKQLVDEKIKEEIRKKLETDKTKLSGTQQKKLQEGIFQRYKPFTINNNKKILQVNNLTYRLIELEKLQTKPEVKRKNDIIKTREEINRD